MSLNSIEKTNTISSELAKPVSNKIIIEAETGWQLINWRELWRYRDLFFFLVWRDIKTRYAQSILGVGWAIIQPLFSMVVFTVVFGNLAKVSSDGVPYAIFSYTALVPWMYFSNSLAGSSVSLVSASGMVSKVYFPRLVIPLAPVLGKLVDFGVALLILFGMMLYFGFLPTIWALTASSAGKPKRSAARTIRAATEGLTSERHDMTAPRWYCTSPSHGKSNTGRP